MLSIPFHWFPYPLFGYLQGLWKEWHEMGKWIKSSWSRGFTPPTGILIAPTSILLAPTGFLLDESWAINFMCWKSTNEQLQTQFNQRLTILFTFQFTSIEPPNLNLSVKVISWGNRANCSHIHIWAELLISTKW